MCDRDSDPKKIFGKMSRIEIIMNIDRIDKLLNSTKRMTRTTTSTDKNHFWSLISMCASRLPVMRGQV